MLQKTLERLPDSACVASAAAAVQSSGSGDLSTWRVLTQMKSELKQRNPETEMSNSFR